MSRKSFNGSGIHTFPLLKDRFRKQKTKNKIIKDHSGRGVENAARGRSEEAKVCWGCDEQGSWGDVTGTVTQAKLEAAGLERDGRAEDDIMETEMWPSCLNRGIGKAQLLGLRTGVWAGKDRWEEILL